MIELKNVGKIYKTKNSEFSALNNINLKIDKGEFIAITGTSGSGKTTLLSILGLIDIPSSGEYFLNGVDCSLLNKSKLSAIRGNEIGFILQDFGLIDQFTVEENILLSFDFSKKKYNAKKVLKLLDYIGISNKFNTKVSNLSGGQKQRVAFARAICKNPSLILCDEPTGNLDSKTTKELMSLLCKANEKGMSIVIITHDSNVASYAKRIIKIEDGSII